MKGKTHDVDLYINNLDNCLSCYLQNFNGKKKPMIPTQKNLTPEQKQDMEERKNTFYDEINNVRIDPLDADNILRPIQAQIEVFQDGKIKYRFTGEYVMTMIQPQHLDPKKHKAEQKKQQRTIKRMHAIAVKDGLIQDRRVN